ncbi:hypothetical protein NQZ68_023007 [Dissostichus eleginoides]|nr:hypothetical protein NQZ68_023007 [Dissostichus eleginoides]
MFAGATSTISSQPAYAAKAIASSAAPNQSQSGVHKYSLKGLEIARGDPFDTAPSLSTRPVFNIRITAAPYGRYLSGKDDPLCTVGSKARKESSSPVNDTA